MTTGRFARLSGAAVHALRHYDDVGASPGARGDAADGTATRDVLARHRDRLERQRSLITAQLLDVTRFLDEGLEMPVMQRGCRLPAAGWCK